MYAEFGELLPGGDYIMQDLRDAAGLFRTLVALEYAFRQTSMKQDVVSIITPFWNAERFLKEAIDSVFAQTYSKWELLLIDDGSTDASTEIAKDFATHHPHKIRYLEHPNHEHRDISASRNAGIREATGEYIALLDADDVWLPDKLEKQVSILRTYPEAAMVFGTAIIWFGWTNLADDVQHDYVYVPDLPPNHLIKPPELLLAFLLRKIDVPAISNPMFRRKVVLDVGGFEESIPRFVEFDPLLCKIYLNHCVYFANECWSKYRLHSDSVMGRITLEKDRVASAKFRFLTWFEDFLYKQGLQETEVWRVVQNRLWPYRHPLLSDLSRSVLPLLRKVIPTPMRQWLQMKYADTSSRVFYKR